MLLSVCAAPAIAQGPPPHLPAGVLADAPEPARVNYLKQHVVVEGPVTGGLTFSFDDDFYSGRLFLLGESHGSAAPQVLDIELLTHLNARLGLTDYLGEVDPVQAHRLNRYLDTGDETLLDRVFDRWNADSQWANTAYEDKLRAIRRLNAGLPAGQRIRIHGIDAIQDWPLVAEELQARGAPLDAAAFASARGTSRARLAADALARAPDAAADAYLLQALERQAVESDRETIIFNNYAALVRSDVLGDRPAYGLWGATHVMQGPLRGRLPFGGRVRASDLPSADGVRSLVVYGLDSAFQFPVPLPTGVARVRFTDGNVDGPVVKLAGSASLREASAPHRLTVFRIDADRSPYREGQQLIALRSSMDPGLLPSADVPTSGYAQYVGVYRGSDWAAPREGAGPTLSP
ncbi:erythromycin esterase family protein [Cognatilysobacter bugurensis]|nr:erythromycin esterase family protein [Lysobacter bugurensis]